MKISVECEEGEVYKHLESYVTVQCGLNQSYLKAHLAYINRFESRQRVSQVCHREQIPKTLRFLESL